MASQPFADLFMGIGGTALFGGLLLIALTRGVFIIGSGWSGRFWRGRLLKVRRATHPQWFWVVVGLDAAFLLASVGWLIAVFAHSPS
jgi:hypothetical protein